MSGGVVSAARRRGAQVHSHRAHYCSCGFVGFGNGAEWSHRRRCADGRWLTPTQWDKLQWHDAAGHPGSVAQCASDICRGLRLVPA
jgi:hypothetical protein